MLFAGAWPQHLSSNCRHSLALSEPGVTLALSEPGAALAWEAGKALSPSSLAIKQRALSPALSSPSPKHMSSPREEQASPLLRPVRRLTSPRPDIDQEVTMRPVMQQATPRLRPHASPRQRPGSLALGPEDLWPQESPRARPMSLSPVLASPRRRPLSLASAQGTTGGLSLWQEAPGRPVVKKAYNSLLRPVKAQASPYLRPVNVQDRDWQSQVNVQDRDRLNQVNSQNYYYLRPLISQASPHLRPKNTHSNQRSVTPQVNCCHNPASLRPENQMSESQRPANQRPQSHSPCVRPRSSMALSPQGPSRGLAMVLPSHSCNHSR